MRDQPKIELLQAEVDEDDQSFFRLLVDGKSIKYLTIDPGLYTTEDMCFDPSLTSLLPDFPHGDWNDGLVAKSTTDGKPYFARAERTQFPGVRHQWHKTYVDYLDLAVGDKLRTGIYEVKCPQFDTAVIAKFARFEWEIQYLENETIAYQWIEGHQIGPRFFGHLIEDGNARHAGPSDLVACQQTLRRLHQLGIRHGDLNRFNFLVRPSNTTLIDFDTAQKCEDQVALQEEFESLPRALGDTSIRGGDGGLPTEPN
ncbi:hypothetical protein Plec18170_004455 [Paecilomyces lecythidis]